MGTYVYNLVFWRQIYKIDKDEQYTDCLNVCLCIKTREINSPSCCKLCENLLIIILIYCVLKQGYLWNQISLHIHREMFN